MRGGINLSISTIIIIAVSIVVLVALIFFVPMLIQLAGEGTNPDRFFNTPTF